jgi:hypothetical protein
MLEAIFIGLVVIVGLFFLAAGAVAFVALLPLILIALAIGLLFVAPGWGIALIAVLVFGWMMMGRQA